MVNSVQSGYIAWLSLVRISLLSKPLPTDSKDHPWVCPEYYHPPICPVKTVDLDCQPLD
jgi:hypothetical protein